MKIILSFLLLVLPAFATNYTVKAGGGGSFTTIAACTAQMVTNGTGVSDTCTVFAGTYNETPTVAPGSAGNYKILNVNSTDLVYVRGFTAASYSKIVGFQIQYPTSPGNGCITIPNGTTYLYITNNVISQCVVSASAMINISYPNTASYVFIQGNTFSYGGVVASSCVNTTLTSGFSSGASSIAVASVGGAQNGWTVYGTGLDISNGTFISSIASLTVNLSRNTIGTGTNGEAISLCPSVANSINAVGDHWLVENNDLSHYTLSIDFLTNSTIFRNNTFHDQLQAEGKGNTHTDTFFSEPCGSSCSVPVQYNVMEGNVQRNAIGPDAKGLLAQDENCGATCFNIIERFNTVSRIGGGITSNDANPGWSYFKVYNNSWVDMQYDSTSSNPITDNHAYNGSGTLGPSTTSELNNLFYYPGTASSITSSWNPYSTPAGVVYGYNLVYCPHCSAIYPHTYGSGSWTSDTGNVNANPNFVSYVSAGSLSNDYHLQTGSPAIAAGRYLTTVAAGDSGSGTSLVVNDASYFQDSYGLSNDNSTVYPDCISVTTVGNHVCITAVNYSTNTLTLASGFTRSNGDHVWLYSKSDGVQVLTGSAPEMGAYPYSPAAQTAPFCLACSNLYSKVVLP